ncbi:MAG: hypothetical protein KDK97_12820 [Verrucomicrobiales bacterium]|nr:hypothetical protein [Verrucomicrobiales bacterium]
MNSILNQPLIWIPVLAVVLATLAFLGAGKSRGSVRIGLGIVGAACVLLASYVLVAVFAPGLVDARIRVYQTFFENLQPGMTRFEVLASLEKHYPADGPRQRPRIMKDTANELGFFMNPEDSYEPNCEGIFLDFADGKVTRKRYSED